MTEMTAEPQNEHATATDGEPAAPVNTGEGAPEPEAAPVSETPVETDSQNESQAEQPEPATEVPAATDTVAPEALARENAELRAAMREAMELIKARETAASKPPAPPAPNRGAWKEKAKRFANDDAAALTDMIEGAISERVGELEKLREEFNFYKPHIDRMGVEHEMNRGMQALMAETGATAAEVAGLRPTVDKMLASGYRAPTDVLFKAAYAESLMKKQKSLATKTLAARTPSKPSAPAPKNTAGPSQPKYNVVKHTPGTDPKETWQKFLSQFERYK